MDNYWVWCGSVVKGEDNKYHMFASRWSKEYPMHPGWLAASEIVRAVSDKPEGPYRFEEVVLPARGPEFWDGRSTHNPQIKKHRNTYILYYMGTTHPFPEMKDPSVLKSSDPLTIVARSNKRIGIATSKSIYGPWKRKDAPILNTRPSYFDNFFTSNPAPCLHEDGSCIMLYKTRTYKALEGNSFLHGKMSFGVASSAAYNGEYKAIRNSPLFEGEGIEMEDPFIWKDEDGYNLIAKDMTGKICGEYMGGIQAISKDGIHWDLLENTLSYSRRIVWDDNVERLMGNLERPFILFEEGKPICAFFATSDGTTGGGFKDCTRTWNMAILLNSSGTNQ